MALRIDTGTYFESLCGKFTIRAYALRDTMRMCVSNCWVTAKIYLLVRNPRKL